MVLRIFIVGLLVLNVTSLFAEESACRKLADAITISFPSGTPGLVKAGEEAKLPVKIVVSDRHLLDPFETVPITFYVSNGLLGSKSYFSFLNIKRSGSEGVTYQEHFVVKVPFGANTFGHYDFKAHMTFFTETTYCAEKLLKIPHEMMVVLNDPDKVDIHAPVVTGTNVDKATYRMGERVSLTFDAVDKSPLCTADLVKAKRCEMVWHLSLIDGASGREVHVYPEIERTEDGRYKTTFELAPRGNGGSPLFAPGTYRVKGINVGDIWGNMMHDLPSQAQTTFSVTAETHF